MNEFAGKNIFGFSVTRAIFFVVTDLFERDETFLKAKRADVANLKTVKFIPQESDTTNPFLTVNKRK
jgi:hypothetical protein